MRFGRGEGGCALHFVEIQSVLFIFLARLKIFNQILILRSEFQQKHFNILHLNFETFAHAQIAITRYCILFTNLT